MTKIFFFVFVAKAVLQGKVNSFLICSTGLRMHKETQISTKFDIFSRFSFETDMIL